MVVINGEGYHAQWICQSQNAFIQDRARLPIRSRVLFGLLQENRPDPRHHSSSPSTNFA